MFSVIKYSGSLTDIRSSEEKMNKELYLIFLFKNKNDFIPVFSDFLHSLQPLQIDDLVEVSVLKLSSSGDFIISES